MSSLTACGRKTKWGITAKFPCGSFQKGEMWKEPPVKYCD